MDGIAKTQVLHMSSHLLINLILLRTRVTASVFSVRVCLVSFGVQVSGHRLLVFRSHTNTRVNKDQGQSLLLLPQLVSFN